MNRLRDLLEKIEAGAPVFPGRLDEKQIAHVEKMALAAGERAVCFYAGDFDDLFHLKIIRPLVKLPFDSCWIEMEGDAECGNKYIIGFLLWNVDGLINGQSWIKKPKEEWIYSCSFQKMECGKTLIGHGIEELGPRPYQVGIHSIELFLTALNCSNVRRTENKPPPSLQKSRSKKGKKPLFSYWTLDVLMPHNGSTKPGAGRNGTAPRVHLRRGHPREYKPGLYCWVQPCVVGKTKEGMVVKDYSAKWNDRNTKPEGAS